MSFRVETNPDKKTAADVAKQINDSRFKNNLSRRLGVLVIQAGVGDKTKELDAVTTERLKRVEEGPDVTHVMAFMFAGTYVRNSSIQNEVWCSVGKLIRFRSWCRSDHSDCDHFISYQEA